MLCRENGREHNWLMWPLIHTWISAENNNPFSGEQLQRTQRIEWLMKILYIMKWEYFWSIYKCYVQFFFGYFPTSDAIIKQPRAAKRLVPRCMVLLWLAKGAAVAIYSALNGNPINQVQINNKEKRSSVCKISFSSKGKKHH